MVSNNSFFSISQLRKRRRYCLALAVLIGLSFGIYTASISSFFVPSLMLSTNAGSVSIVTMLVVVLLPFIISAFAIVLSKPGIMLLLLFTRAFLQGFSLYGLSNCFGHAFWIVCFIHLVTPSFINIALTYFGLRHISGFRKGAIFELCILGAISLCIWLLMNL